MSMATRSGRSLRLSMRKPSSNFPPTWHISSQQWLISSRDDPDPRLVTVAQPMQVWVQQFYPELTSMDSVDHTPDWSTGWETVTHTPATTGNKGPAYARDGNQHTIIASDETIHVWRGEGQSLPPPGGSSSHGGTARDGKASPGKARDGKAGIGTNARNGKWRTGGATGSWQGWSPPAPPNPDRILYRGVGADKRRKQRRELERQGKEIPPELQPLGISLNKGVKREMHELHVKAREMAQEEGPEKLKKWEEEQSIWLEMVAREEAEKKLLPPPSQKMAPIQLMASSLNKAQQTCQMMALMTRLLTTWTLATGQGQPKEAMARSKKASPKKAAFKGVAKAASKSAAKAAGKAAVKKEQVTPKKRKQPDEGSQPGSAAQLPPPGKEA
eukprot:s3841_g3.t1